MVEAGVIAAAFIFGGAVGFLCNTISAWVWRLSKRDGGRSSPTGWPALFGVQFILRLFLSLVSLYVTYRLSHSGWAVAANLLGLLIARYVLIWRLAQRGEGWL